MPFLTAAVLAAFVGYAAAWYFEMVEGNFALLLFLATIVTGLYWIAEQVWYLPRRRRVNEAYPCSRLPRGRFAERNAIWSVRIVRLRRIMSSHSDRS